MARSATVQVSDRAGFEAALLSADRIVVRGDAALIDYAMSRIGAGGEPAAAGGLRPIAEEDRAAHRPRSGGSPRLWPWVAGAIVLAGGAASAFLLEHFATWRGGAGPHPAGAATLDWSRLAWPAVAVGAVLALFLGARRLMMRDGPAPRAWTVVEQGTEELVLSRTSPGRHG